MKIILKISRINILFIIILLLGLIESVKIEKPISKQKVLVLHNIKHFKTLFLDMLRYLNKNFSKVFVFSTKSMKQSLFERGEAKYDMVILIAPKDRLIYDRMEKVGLTKFYDQGGSLIILADPRPSAQFRKLLNEYGLDVINPDNIKEVNPKLVSPNFTHVQNTPLSSWIFVPKNKLILPNHQNQIKKGFWFKGANLMLSIYENSDSWSLLEAPDFSYNFFIPSRDYTRTEQIRRKIIDSDRNGLVVGAQKSDSLSRIVLTGSTEMFSNTAVQISDGDNLELFKLLINWGMFKSHTLNVNFFKVCPEEKEFSDYKSLIKKEKYTNEIDIESHMLFHDYDSVSFVGKNFNYYYSILFSKI